jgi:putative DNA primase/helicase
LTQPIYENGPGDDKEMPGSVNVIEQTPDQPRKKPRLSVGSDVEIASCIKAKLVHDYHSVPHCEGEFWRYTGKQWETIPHEELRLIVHAYDGMPIPPKGHPLQLGKGRINSILNELAAMLSQSTFFDIRPAGINCLSGFITFDHGGPRLVPHAPEHRQRHVIPAQWEPGGRAETTEGSLLTRLLGGSFEGDEDADAKVDLLGEIAGAAALGHGPRLTSPKAVVLLGRTAENGKSQILDLLRGLLPPGAVSSVPPSRFGDDRHSVKLIGRLLNTSDELGTAEAIASDRFKSMITGEPLTGRDVYRPAVDFRPQAQHVFACNQLPAFHGGMDRGVLRRLLVIPFNRTIPPEERVPNIGQRIVAAELDQVLAWAVRGAARLLQRGQFPELATSREAVQEWAQGADPVLGWIEERVIATTLSVVGQEPPRVSTRKAYEDFKNWAEAEGYAPSSLPSVNTFSQRLQAVGPSRGITYKRGGGFRGFIGMRLRPPGDLGSMADADAA